MTVGRVSHAVLTASDIGGRPERWTEESAWSAGGHASISIHELIPELHQTCPFR
jgi:hypothetical protein